MSKTKQFIIKLYNPWEDSHIVLKCNGKTGRESIKLLIDALQLADEYEFELVSISPAA